MTTKDVTKSLGISTIFRHSSKLLEIVGWKDPLKVG